MATGKVTIDEGSTTNLATNTVSEDAVTKHISRSVINTSAGAEVTSWPVTNTGTFATQAAATEADGANVTLGAKADAKSTATDTTAITAMQVLKEISYMEQNPASRAVTNAGTFATQNTDSVTAATGITIKAAYTASQTGGTVLTPTSGKKVVITDIVVSATGAGTIYLFDSTDDATHGIGPILSFSANGGWSSNFKKPFVSAAANNVIKYTSGSGAAGSIWIQYYEV